MVPEAGKIMLDQSFQILLGINIFIYFLEQ